ncbi:MAG: hypothetical protein J7621_05135 [Niastella sp.]|nr:hypothetical protein [Niastella sp.]
MKLIGCFIVSVLLITQNTTAQVTYEPVLTLNPGERVEKFLSCWWLDDQGVIASLVIRQPDGKLSAIEHGKRRNDLTQEDILIRAACERLDPYKVPRESHVQFAALQPNGQWIIRSGNRQYGTYDKIVFMRETEQHFIAIVGNKKGNDESFYCIDDRGNKELLSGRPQHFYTNSQLTKAAVVLFDAGALSAEMINKLPREQQVALYEQMRNASARKQVWVSDGKTYTVDKKSRLFFDASGQHFIEASPTGVFYIDGRQYPKNVSGGGTILFANEAGDSWAYFYEIYLTFKDNFTIKDAINPYLTTEQGQTVVNWYEVKEEGAKVTIRRGKRAL